jgi:hypothetical protein
VNLLLTEVGSASNGFTVMSLNRVRGSGYITNFQLFGLLTLFRLQHDAARHGAESGALSVRQYRQRRPAELVEPRAPAGQVLRRRHEQRLHAHRALLVHARRRDAELPGGYDWILDHEYEANTWMLGLRSPAYPLPSTRASRRKGAAYFHKLNLWAPRRNNPVPPPPQIGNGSCASCHGAYAPRYARSRRFLASPALAGIAANVTPIDVINTDPARMLGNSEAVEGAAEASWFAYYGQDGCAEKYNLIGYLAQPLYGVWASAPYFHNGSVPDVWAVLKSSDRPLFWRRMSKPDQPGVVMGYETDLARGYDPARLGWKYDALPCGSPGLTPYLECDPADPFATPLVESWLGILFANGSLSWNMLGTVLAPTLTNAQIEDRKIYNTRMYSQSNTGHEFTDVLTDTERLAIVEYL